MKFVIIALLSYSVHFLKPYEGWLLVSLEDRVIEFVYA
jgi:hypothetical protein